ncbi:ribosomal protein S18-alanine N-acetyltransferase [Bacillus tianshenii]|nr:ribosomal protein S18-alanine N-acetyltransferase [Bacillus tianshenii]
MEKQQVISFRLMKEQDVDDVMKVEEASFPIPWSKDAFYNEVVHNQFAHYLLLEKDEEVIGYCGIWIIIDEAHITNVAILPEERGNKYGEKLMRQAMDFAVALGAATLSLEVRVSNYVAQNLYRKLGFEAGGIRKNYYADNQEDALVMWVKLK